MNTKKLQKKSETKNKQVKKDYKTLWIHKSKHQEIAQEGKKGETYDDIIDRILKVYRKYKSVYIKENGDL